MESCLGTILPCHPILQIPMISKELWPQAKKKEKRNHPGLIILPKGNADLYGVRSIPSVLRIPDPQ